MRRTVQGPPIKPPTRPKKAKNDVKISEQRHHHLLKCETQYINLIHYLELVQRTERESKHIGIVHKPYYSINHERIDEYVQAHNNIMSSNNHKKYRRHLRMNNLEEQAVKELKRIINRVEEGQFNIQSVGTQTIIQDTNIRTDDGPVQNRALRFEIEHTVYPE